jgi:hypothetical protein
MIPTSAGRAQRGWPLGERHSRAKRRTSTPKVAAVGSAAVVTVECPDQASASAPGLTNRGSYLPPICWLDD